MSNVAIFCAYNASAFTVGDADTKIISIEFATSEAVMAQFYGSIIVGVEAEQVDRSVSSVVSMVIPSVEVTATATDTEDTIAEEVTTTEEENEDVSEPVVIGNTKEQTIEVTVPVTWQEDGEAVVQFFFEFNDSVIGVHQPVETWHSGKHTIFLYYPIDNVLANVRNIFNVYMRVSGGTGTIDSGNCLAAITGQSMGARTPWDGELLIEEKISTISFGGMAVNTWEDVMTLQIGGITRYPYTDVFKNRVAIGAFAMPIETEG